MSSLFENSWFILPLSIGLAIFGISSLIEIVKKPEKIDNVGRDNSLYSLFFGLY